MNWDEYEKLVGINRTERPRPTRADADRIRRKKLSRRWRGIRAVRKR